MNMKLTEKPKTKSADSICRGFIFDTIGDILASPVDKTPLIYNEGSQSFSAPHGTENYKEENGTVDILPPEEYTSDAKWKTWNTLQDNGVKSYNADPENNLSMELVAGSPAEKFANFSKYTGHVLDVGCGPQSWPSYFLSKNTKTQFVGIDPLIEKSLCSYPQLKALGEFMPFIDDSFDRVLFATSLDHLVDPVQCLKESRRVCRNSGFISVWIGTKSPNAPKPKEQPKWYLELEKPEGAEDFFHFKRLDEDDTEEIFKEAGLKIARKVVHQISEYRSNIFYELV